MLLQMALFHSFNAEWYSIVCIYIIPIYTVIYLYIYCILIYTVIIYYCDIYIYHIFLIRSSVNRHLGCFHVLAIVNSAVTNVSVHVSFWIIVSSGYMPRTIMATLVF